MGALIRLTYGSSVAVLRAGEWATTTFRSTADVRLTYPGAANTVTTHEGETSYVRFTGERAAIVAEGGTRASPHGVAEGEEIKILAGATGTVIDPAGEAAWTTAPLPTRPPDALEDMGPVLEEMDRRIADLRASIAAILAQPRIEPPATLVAYVQWIRSQLETDVVRLSTLKLILEGMPAEAAVTSASSTRDSLEFRVNQLVEQLVALESALDRPGATGTAASLDAGTVAVGDLILRLERHVEALRAVDEIEEEVRVVTPVPPISGAPSIVPLLVGGAAVIAVGLILLGSD